MFLSMVDGGVYSPDWVSQIGKSNHVRVGLEASVCLKYFARLQKKKTPH
jgi:hypothetical protein